MTNAARRYGRLLSVCSILAAAGAVEAADLPPIKVTDANQVMACATPGRLMAYLKSNNPRMDAKFEGLATDYMKVGQEYGLRWDYTFFQMLVETGYLKFTGDVDVKQNNFAGLGATGKGVKGESFPDPATGARAHLQHVLMYAGETVENPVAQRTRDVQAWGVLTKWQQSLKKPMTFKDLASKWAPGSRGYPRDIASVAERFANGPCKDDDPQPELVAAAAADASQPPLEAKPSAKSEQKDRMAAADPSPAQPDIATSAPQPTGSKTETGKVKVINSPPAPEPPAAPEESPADPKPESADAGSKAAGAKATSDKAAKPADKSFTTASVANDAAKAKVAETPKSEKAETAKGKCKVWQASYGGSKAVIIKATAETTTNYTVLDVNEGAEKREADAYIAAYAKGGATVAEFASSTQALEKAFELCPEG